MFRVNYWKPFCIEFIKYRFAIYELQEFLYMTVELDKLFGKNVKIDITGWKTEIIIQEKWWTQAQ